jgi:hypothetical protein
MIKSLRVDRSPTSIEEEAAMASDIELVVLRDAKGEYFVLPRANVERARVPKEYRGELERMMAAASGRRNEELSKEQLEAVVGGVSSPGTLTVSSQLANSIQSGGGWDTI